MEISPFMEATLWSLLAAVGTAIGGGLVYVFRNPSDKLLDGAMGFAAGVMLSALAYGLIPTAITHDGLWITALMVLVGAFAMAMADRYLPHIHPRFKDDSGYQAHHQDEEYEIRPSLHAERRSFMAATALTLHNIPEGAAVGAAFAAGGANLGIPLALAIAAHNIPEGFAVIAPLLREKTNRRKVALFGAATGLVEVPAAILAYTFLSFVYPLLGIALGFAAGAMLYVAVDELIPESSSHGNGRIASMALVAGFLILLVMQQLVAQITT